jgi:hypothetical protein
MTPLTLTFAAFASFFPSTFATFSLCQVTVSPFILVLSQECLKGFGMVVLRCSRLELNGELATNVEVLVHGQVTHGLLLGLQCAPENGQFIGKVLGQGESP